MIPQLVGRTVLVTGASGTVGTAVVDALSRAGARAVAADIVDSAELALDVTSETDWTRAIAAVERDHGGLDGLVNAAGVAALGTIEETDYATWRHVLSVNLDGTFLGCRHAWPLLKPRGGSIVNLSSVFGLVGAHNLAAYCASKGAVRMLTKAVALHGARLNPPVRCNSVHPAFLEGAMVDTVTEQTGAAEGARVRLVREIPLGRYGTATEVADLCVYLLSDQARYVTAAEFAIDGGYTAR